MIVQITIKVNGRELRVKTQNIFENIEAWVEKQDKRQSQAPIVAGVHSLLEHFKPKKYVRPDHLLLCSCRSCEVSIRTYTKRMKQL